MTLSTNQRALSTPGHQRAKPPDRTWHRHLLCLLVTVAIAASAIGIAAAPTSALAADTANGTPDYDNPARDWGGAATDREWYLRAQIGGTALTEMIGATFKDLADNKKLPSTLGRAFPELYLIRS
ncbi:MAG: hypothetical protein AAFY28_17010, partial [Actinomycetota bacterium]